VSLRRIVAILALVFTWASYLWDRISGTRTRADELRDVRHRLVKQPKRNDCSAEEAQIALQLRTLREQFVFRLGDVQACSRCVRPQSTRWPGGHCCSGHTRDRFSDCELGALRLSGTTPRHMLAPRSEQAGCVFRGPRGCSLAVAHRPFLCVSYLCRDLQNELDQRGDGAPLAELKRELHLQFERFVEARTERERSTELQALEASLSNGARHSVAKRAAGR